MLRGRGETPMNTFAMTCKDRDRIFEDGSPAEWAALEAHAASCAICSGEIRAWKSLSVAAAELRDYTVDPALWPRIGRSLVEQASNGPSSTRWSWGSWLVGLSISWQAVAAATIVFLLSVSGWIYIHETVHRTGQGTGTAQEQGDLLKSQALADVEQTESAYVKAIDKLAVAAKPQLDKADTPLLANYREKLQVLDSAIDDLRAQAGENPSNAHLRYQLLAMYQEKQQTLEEVLEEKHQ
jgi:hypothetical protein